MDLPSPFLIGVLLLDGFHPDLPLPIRIKNRLGVSESYGFLVPLSQVRIYRNGEACTPGY